MKNRITSRWLLLATAVLALTILAFDIGVELGVAAGVPYVALVCLSYFGPSRRWIWVAAAGGISLTLVGYVCSEVGGEPWKVLLNRFLAIFAIGVTATFVELAKRRQMLLEDQERNLQRLVDDRTFRLEESEERMRRTFESSPLGLVIVNESGKITMVNKQMTRMFGYQREEMLGQTIEVLVPEPFRRKHESHRNRYRRNSEAREMGSDKDLQGLRLDGTSFPVEIDLTPIDDAAGKSTMATVVDISVRKNHEASIERKNEQLRRLNLELLEFAYCASHDLKAPLVSIAGLLEVCADDLDQGDVDEVRVNIKKASGLAQRLASRVESTLSLAKSDMRNGDWESISVGPRIFEAWNSLPHEGVTLETQFDHVDPILSVGARFDVVIENLLSNALKYQDPAESEKKVSVTTWTVGDSFYLAIKDNGVGIPEEYQARVFRLFHRLAGQDTDGAGMGLPLVKKNVARLGGWIELKSDDVATVFTVILPQDDGRVSVREDLA